MQIALLCLHIKLGIFQQLVKTFSDRKSPGDANETLKGNKDALDYLKKKFNYKTTFKVKQGCFRSPEIDKLIKSKEEFGNVLR